jgi:UDP-3-O-[3-hydroxymyristoyl] glucosamine N-acyltransferase
MNKQLTSAQRNGTVSDRRLDAAAIRKLCGADILDDGRFTYVDGVTTPDRIKPNRLLFIDRDDAGLIDGVATASAESILIIAPDAARQRLTQPRIITDRPRLVFAQIVNGLFDCHAGVQTEAIHPSARIHPTARLSYGVTIGPGSEIGAYTLVYPNVVVGPRVSVGSHCVVKSGTVIGQAGFGVYRDGENRPHVLPHIAGVVIGDHVEIGALNTVASGTIHPTVIEDFVKTDDHVHVAHNCFVGARTLLTACAELSGSVTVGRDCWIGPNAAIRDGLSVGDGAFVGIAANVVRSVADGETVYGNPARPRG